MHKEKAQPGLGTGKEAVAVVGSCPWLCITTVHMCMVSAAEPVPVILKRLGGKCPSFQMFRIFPLTFKNRMSF